LLNAISDLQKELDDLKLRIGKNISFSNNNNNGPKKKVVINGEKPSLIFAKIDKKLKANKNNNNQL
jgi:hypothetical protein